MDDTYRESAPLLPRNLTLVIAGVLAATLICMALTRGDSPMPAWVIPLSAAIFVIAVVFLLIARLDVEVDDEKVSFRFLFKEHVYKKEEILDKRVGALEAIKNYSQWDLKGVKHKSYTRVGEDDGVAIKLMGKRVTVLSSKTAQELFERIPVEDKEDL